MSEQRNNNNQNRNQGKRHHGGGKFHKGRNNQRRYHQKKSLPPSRIVIKYDNLLDQHLQARRKYYEMYYRVDYPALDKLEKNFYDTLDNLRRFESRLEPWQRDILQKRTDGYKLDLDYSTNNNISAVGDNVPAGPHKEQHINDKQLNRPSYANDREESVGTDDDYIKYAESKS
ncbi:MAG: hypothetical protein JNM93_02080 [Bacteriovoracaceae bacterium]|nr:hypothetical protein [Bacteriovoracaceae bacterium]